MTLLHGIKVNEPVTGARPIVEKLSSVIGLVATGPDADAAAFPLDKPVLVTSLRAALAKAGTQGTLVKALTEISLICDPVMVVVRVAPGVAGPGVTAAEATDINVIGGTVGNAYTGMQALLAASAQVGVKPRILGAPGLDSEDVVAAFAALAPRLNGFAYTACAECDDVDDAIVHRTKFGARELMGIWPDFTGGAGGTWSGKAVAIALAMRARIDSEVGWHKSLSNVAVPGVTGLTRDIDFDIQDMDTAAGVLNAGDVTTLVRANGYRFWGNRTYSDEPLFAFEVAVPSAQAIRDAIADGLVWSIDKPLTMGLVRDIVETINARLRRWVAQGRLIGGRCWYDPDSNAAADLAAGQLVLDYDFTPCAPLEGLTLNQRITGKYYQGFGDDLA